MIYLDHAATTPVAPEVAEAMQPYLTERFGNPSSIHAFGREVRAALDDARDAVAAALHADYSEIYFTSGGTEADNLALIGAMLAAPPDRDHLIVSATEHHAVLHAARFLESQGRRVTCLPVDGEGRVSPDDLEAALDDRTALVSVMHGSNEIGTLQDVPRLARLAHARGALFHTDAVQTFGALPLHVRGLDCDMLSVSAHKIYGPKGVGALYVRSGVKVSPIMFGGTQERERRPGTENTAGIVGFGKAVELMAERREEESARLTALRDGFIAGLLNAIPGVRLNGSRENRLPNNVNISIAGVDGAAVLLNLDRAGIAASSGSACSSGSIEPSHVLKAIGLPDDLAASGIRLTLGRGTTQEELEEAVGVLAEIVRRLRGQVIQEGRRT
jgi:cysteine desulfurase